MDYILLNIGSNMGDRRANLARAVALLREHLHPQAMDVSDPVETAPDGFDSPNPFLNIAVMLHHVALTDPHDVLAITQKVEQLVGHGTPHRHPDG